MLRSQQNKMRCSSARQAVPPLAALILAEAQAPWCGKLLFGRRLLWAFPLSTPSGTAIHNVPEVGKRTAAAGPPRVASLQQQQRAVIGAEPSPKRRHSHRGRAHPEPPRRAGSGNSPRSSGLGVRLPVPRGWAGQAGCGRRGGGGSPPAGAAWPPLTDAHPSSFQQC